MLQRCARCPHGLGSQRQPGVQREMGDGGLDLLREAVADAGRDVHGQVVHPERGEDGDDGQRAVSSRQLGTSPHLPAHPPPRPPRRHRRTRASVARQHARNVGRIGVALRIGLGGGAAPVAQLLDPLRGTQSGVDAPAGVHRRREAGVGGHGDDDLFDLDTGEPVANGDLGVQLELLVPSLCSQCRHDDQQAVAGDSSGLADISPTTSKANPPRRRGDVATRPTQRSGSTPGTNTVKVSAARAWRSS